MGKKSRQNKKGMSMHLEMIMSFGIFLMFLLFLFSYMSPVKKPDVSDVLIDIVSNALDGYSVNILEVPAILKTIPEKTCFRIKSPFDLAGVDTQKQIFVKDASSNELGFRIAGDSIEIQKAGETEIQDFYRIYLSDRQLPSSQLSVGSDCTDLTVPEKAGSYEFSISRLTTHYLYSELQKLNANYNAGTDQYSALKKQFAFPLNSDFGIIIKDLNGKELFSMMIGRPKGITVKAREIPVEIFKIDEDNAKTVEKAVMNIQVW